MRVQRLITRGSLLSPNSLSIDLKMVAVLEDGSELTALDGRGFTWADSRHSRSDDWVERTFRELTNEALTAVGPDEPADRASRDDTEHWHWDAIAQDLTEQGVAVTGAQLAALPTPSR